MDATVSCVRALDRQTLLQLRNHAASDLHDDIRCKLRDLGLLRSPGLQSSSSPDAGNRDKGRRKRCSRKRKRGKRAGVRARLTTNPSRPALPSIILSNVRSLDNKLDIIRLQQASRREFRHCCVFVFTETWLSDRVPDAAIQLTGLTVFGADRNPALCVLDQGRVKHYKIKRLDNGQYFVSKWRSFITLKELVEYYSSTEDGLCVRLTQPCKKAEAPQTHGLSYNTVDQWEIPRSSVRLLRKLGSGQFGEVFEGLWNNTTSVAVKTLRPGSMDSHDFLREAQIMKKLRHPKLIQLYAVCTVGEPIYIITELMDHGSLLEYLQKDRGEFVAMCDQVEMGAQVAAGMAFLELQNYIHRDLAARNVLVGDNNICKVADFGLARVFKAEGDNVYDCEDTDEDCVYEVKHGTKLPVKWTAPEVLYDNKFTIKSDVWSFGILLYEIMTFGQTPYPTLTNMQVVQRVRTSYRMPCPANCPKRIYDIMMECWKDTPPDRPTFETLQWKLEEFYDVEISEYDDAGRY